VGLAGMLGVWPALEMCAAVGQAMVLQATFAPTVRVSCVFDVRVHPDGAVDQVAPVPALNVNARCVCDHPTVQETTPPETGTLPVGLAGMLGVWPALERWAAVGQAMELQAVLWR